MKLDLASATGFALFGLSTAAHSSPALRGGDVAFASSLPASPPKDLFFVNATQTMDIFVLAYSWQPEFCYGKTNYYGCSHPSPAWNVNFTLHGLWPQYSTGGYPSYCTTEAFDPSVPDKVGWTDMTTYWPNAQYATTDPNYDEFWDHEWTKHGTCAQQSQYDYFKNAIALIKKFGTPASVSNAAGGTVSANTVRNDFGGASMASLQCESGQYLSGVFTCWAQQNYVPTNQIVCPSDVQKEDTCTASTLQVVAL